MEEEGEGEAEIDFQGFAFVSPAKCNNNITQNQGSVSLLERWKTIRVPFSCADGKTRRSDGLNEQKVTNNNQGFFPNEGNKIRAFFVDHETELTYVYTL